ncbi:uncharacterized protein [Miscanthus floridulus]|uniref:uncharacterized protein n=1 Tax=Miscanthus floridulus TaxID=154761 RepID=UPI003457F82F
MTFCEPAKTKIHTVRFKAGGEQFRRVSVSVPEVPTPLLLGHPSQDPRGGSHERRRQGQPRLPLGPAHASPAACSGGGGVGGSGSSKAKRRLFAVGSGSRSSVASAAAAAAAEVDWLHRRRQLILLAGAMASVAVSFIEVMRRRRKYSAQQFARLHDAIVGLASAVRAATAPVEPHPDLYPTVMGIPGFIEEQLLAVLFYLNQGRPRGMMFLAMSELHRMLWIEQILAKQEL